MTGWAAGTVSQTFSGCYKTDSIAYLIPTPVASCKIIGGATVQLRETVPLPIDFQAGTGTARRTVGAWRLRRYTGLESSSGKISLTLRIACVLFPFMSGPPATAAAQTAHPEPQQDPQQEAAASGDVEPGRIGRALSVVRKLITYGKQLVGTLSQRAIAATEVYSITLDFGTTDLAEIIARIARALDLAAALEDRLVSRAAQPERTPPANLPSDRQPRAAPPGVPATPPAAARDDDAKPCLAGLPTAEDLAAQFRRRPIGAVIADICRDLGIKPYHPLWRELSWAILDNGGNVSELLKHIFKRDSQFFEHWCAKSGIDMNAPFRPPQPREAWDTGAS